MELMMLSEQLLTFLGLLPRGIHLQTRQQLRLGQVWTDINSNPGKMNKNIYL